MSGALVIGAGPAGLMAAEQMAAAGLQVQVADQMPSVGRKLLMAGKSGLNLTMDAPRAQFLERYPDLPPALRAALMDFGPAEVQRWAQGLGQELFTGSTGRVFPKAMKASPLLRAWLRRLAGAGVQITPRWRWRGWDTGAALFETPGGSRRLCPDVTVLALGGASWARLGADGAWAGWVDGVAPFAPSNAALRLTWSAPMAKVFGQPVKGIALRAGDQISRGEITISAKGLEGGGLYPLTPALRAGAGLVLDLAPDLTLDALRARLTGARGKASLSNHLRKRLGLSPAKLALLQEFARPLPDDLPGQLAPLLKALPITGARLAPLDEAISTAGGLRFDVLTPDLMLTARPGVFAAGEMLDWEAPTGGYLLTACLATGRLAGQAAARYAPRR